MSNIYFNNKQLNKLRYIVHYYKKSMSRDTKTLSEEMPIIREIEVRLEGKKPGRPRRKLPKDFEKHYKKWEKGSITAIEFSRLIGVSRATLYRYIKKYEM